MKKDIQELLDDHNLFARQIANVRLSNLSFDVYEFRDNYVMQVDLIFAEKVNLILFKRHFQRSLKRNCLMERSGKLMMTQTLQVNNG